jgi:hypothetical protein
MKDLTRRNREGPERFRYVDGNAVTHLKTLSRRLEEAFPHWPDVARFARGSEEKGNEEKPSQTRERMLAQYQSESRDWAWQILRTFARATHVLTEHIDAYANESYLGTATQWDNPTRTTPVGTIATVSPNELFVNGKPGNLRTGQWMVGLGSNPQDMQALRIQRISTGENAFAVAFHRLKQLPLKWITGPFQPVLRPLGHDSNSTPLQSDYLTLDASMAAAALPALTPGRRLVLECTTAEASASGPRSVPVPHIPSPHGGEGQGEGSTDRVR